MPIGSANVLVVDEEFVEIGQGPYPSNAEEPDRRAGPDPLDQVREILALGQPDPAPLGEALEVTGPNDAWAGNEIAFSQHDVGGEIVSSPALDQCGYGRTEPVEKMTQLKAL